mgnify:CR=1 FL=1
MAKLKDSNVEDVSGTLSKKHHTGVMVVSENEKSIGLNFQKMKF